MKNQGALLTQQGTLRNPKSFDGSLQKTIATLPTGVVAFRRPTPGTHLPYDGYEYASAFFLVCINCHLHGPTVLVYAHPYANILFTEVSTLLIAFVPGVLTITLCKNGVIR